MCLGPKIPSLVYLGPVVSKLQNPTLIPNPKPSPPVLQSVKLDSGVPGIPKSVVVQRIRAVLAGFFQVALKVRFIGLHGGWGFAVISGLR